MASTFWLKSSTARWVVSSTWARRASARSVIRSMAAPVATAKSSVRRSRCAVRVCAKASPEALNRFCARADSSRRRWLRPSPRVASEFLQGRALHRDDLVQAVGLAFEPSGQVVGAAADGLIEAGADVFQVLRQGLRAGVDLFEEGVGESLQIAVDLGAARLDGVGSLLAGALEAFEQACGAALKLQHHGVARPGETRIPGRRPCLRGRGRCARRSDRAGRSISRSPPRVRWRRCSGHGTGRS